MEVTERCCATFVALKNQEWFHAYSATILLVWYYFLKINHWVFTLSVVMRNQTGEELLDLRHVERLSSLTLSRVLQESAQDDHKSLKDVL
jgi:hypothetical protein